MNDRPRMELSAKDITNWRIRRSFSAANIDTHDLGERKREAGVAISVVLPVLDPTQRIAPKCQEIRQRLIVEQGLVDELVVVDCTAGGAAAAESLRAGARGFRIEQILPEIAPVKGWGDAVWRSLHVASGDMIVWLRPADAHTTSHIPALLAPLLDDEGIAYVRAFHPLEWTGDLVEAFVRPAIPELFPELGVFDQPLMGSSAGRRAILSQLPFMTGQSADITLLIDLIDLLGLDSTAQVELGPLQEPNEEAALAISAPLVARILLRRAVDRGRVGRSPGTVVRSLLAVAAMDRMADVETERLPMRFAPLYMEGLRRGRVDGRREPIHAALGR